MDGRDVLAAVAQELRMAAGHLDDVAAGKYDEDQDAAGPPAGPVAPEDPAAPDPDPSDPLSEGRVSPHFKLAEFRCKCGGQYCNGYAGFPEEEAAGRLAGLAAVLEKGRALINARHPAPDGGERTVSIVSGIRCERENASVGGAGNSWHMQCLAADVSTPGVRTDLIWDEVNPDGGVGFASNGKAPHVDRRGYRERFTH
jgi:hypothetical protein